VGGGDDDGSDDAAAILGATMLWRYSARPYDRTGKNPEVLIGFFAKNAISRLQKVLSAKI
jgi:hypothetical protein